MAAVEYGSVLEQNEVESVLVSVLVVAQFNEVPVVVRSAARAGNKVVFCHDLFLVKSIHCKLVRFKEVFVIDVGV